MRLSSLSPFVLAAALIPHAYAWGAVGHEVVATIAQMHLHPTVMPKLCHILHATDEACHLASVATWADNIRRQGRYRWTGPLHYINAVDDYPSATCAFPGARGWQGRTHINVLSAIRNTTGVLQAFEDADGANADADVPYYVQDALKFLIHFLGDMHMPLHLTGRNRGGNGDKVAFDGRTTNLHSVWDSLLISERLRTLPRNYTRPLPLPDVEAHLRDTIYDPYIRRLVWQGVLGAWQDELEGWLVCPEPVSSSARAAVPRQRSSAAAWQSVLSLFGKDEDENEDGLGVDDADLCPYAWAKPIHQFTCDFVYPKELDLAPLEGEDDEVEYDGDENALVKKKSRYLELYTPEYTGVIKERWIVEKLLTQGGVRLAGVLNWIFADEDVSEDEVDTKIRRLAL